MHFFETPTQLKFVLLTDTRVGNMRTVLYQIWATLYVDFVVKNPLAPIEHTKGVGVANELFEGGLEKFMVPYQKKIGFWKGNPLILTRPRSFRRRSKKSARIYKSF